MVCHPEYILEGKDQTVCGLLHISFSALAYECDRALSSILTVSGYQFILPYSLLITFTPCAL